MAAGARRDPGNGVRGGSEMNLMMMFALHFFVLSIVGLMFIGLLFVIYNALTNDGKEPIPICGFKRIVWTLITRTFLSTWLIAFVGVLGDVWIKLANITDIPHWAVVLFQDKRY